jgi:hypothetical protein
VTGPYYDDDAGAPLYRAEPQVALPLRERVVPMLTSAMQRVPLLGLDVIGWDFTMVLQGQGLVAGFVCAVRGVDLTGPLKELARFEPFDTWGIDQNKADRVVNTCIEALREFRATQVRGRDGHH